MQINNSNDRHLTCTGHCSINGLMPLLIGVAKDAGHSTHYAYIYSNFGVWANETKQQWLHLKISNVDVKQKNVRRREPTRKEAGGDEGKRNRRIKISHNLAACSTTHKSDSLLNYSQQICRYDIEMKSRVSLPICNFVRSFVGRKV